MTAPRRLLESQGVLPPELVRALRGTAAEPSQPELAALASKLGTTVGVALPVPAPVVSTKALLAGGKATVSGSATLGGAAAKPLAVLGVWVLGGVAIGAGLSGVAYSFSATDDPAPQVRPVVSAVAQAVPREPTAVPVGVEVAAPNNDAHTPPSAAVSGRAASELATAEPAPAPEAESEISFLKRARAATSADPAQALALTAEHAKRYPGGALEQEREVIAIDALLRMGRQDEAAQRAKRFQERYPGSAHARRMGSLATGG